MPGLANTHGVLESVLDGHRLRLALNLDDHPCDLAVPAATTVLAGAGSITTPGAEDARVTVPPHGWVVLD